MDDSVKLDIHRIQRAIWALQQAVELLSQVDGMSRYCDTLVCEIDALNQELSELHQIG